jgi:hypothetical protein
MLFTLPEMEGSMSKVQNGMPVSDISYNSMESVPKAAQKGQAGADRELREEPDMDNETEMGGHTLLSRRQAPQGRRSLFRR